MSVCYDRRTTFAFNFNLKRLISYIYESKCLWDQKDENYSNKVAVREAWDEIGKKMDCSVEVCRHKWRNLRDVFRRELKKYHCRLIDPNITDKSTPRWYYFNDMQFLTQQILGFDSDTSPDFTVGKSDDSFDSFYVKNDSTNFDPVKHEHDSDAEDLTLDENNDIFFITELEEQSREESDAFVEVRYNQDQPIRGNLQETVRVQNVADNERKRRRIETDEENDSDYHFLMSLLPYLRAMPQNRKMLVRTKIQSIFCEEMVDSSRPPLTD